MEVFFFEVKKWNRALNLLTLCRKNRRPSIDRLMLSSPRLLSTSLFALLSPSLIESNDSLVHNGSLISRVPASDREGFN